MALQVDFLQKLFTPKVELAVKRLASGESYQQVADELCRDKETIKSYAAVFRRAMKARSMVEAVAKAVAKGIISIKEVDGKTLIACGLIALSSFHSDYVMARSVRTIKTARRENAIPESANVGEMAAERPRISLVLSMVSVRFSGRAVR